MTALDNNRFDGLARALAHGVSRRAVLRGLGGAVVGTAMASRHSIGALAAQDCQALDDTCGDASDCCAGLICSVQDNTCQPPSSTTCSFAGDSCTTDADCCGEVINGNDPGRLTCGADGTCQSAGECLPLDATCGDASESCCPGLECSTDDNTCQQSTTTTTTTTTAAPGTTTTTTTAAPETEASTTTAAPGTETEVGSSGAAAVRVASLPATGIGHESGGAGNIGLEALAAFAAAAAVVGARVRRAADKAKL